MPSLRLSMFRLTGKTVYLISHERWGEMKISKHHYAHELAHRGCQVFFIEPPDLSRQGISVTPSLEHPGLHIVRYRPFFRGKRFLPPSIYSLLIRMQVRSIIRAIGHKPDVIWCFQGYLYHNLRYFGAGINLFFAADHFPSEELPSELDSADLILTVSATIRQRLLTKGVSCHQINHGLQRIFAEKALQKLGQPVLQRQRLQPVVGYSGNLRIETIDRRAMLEVIRSLPGYQFVFWGSYQAQDLNLYGLRDPDTENFLSQLQCLPNVVLRGPLPAAQLAEEMNGVDILWLCWQFKGLPNRDNANSHKILEYLSTGIPVITHEVLAYEQTDLMYMLPMDQASDFPDFFIKTAALVLQGEDATLPRRRISFALENSYAHHLDHIEQLMNAIQS